MRIEPSKPRFTIQQTATGVTVSALARRNWLVTLFLMAWLGACPPGHEPETAPGNHSNLVVFDEEPLPAGVALYAAMALDALAG